MNSYLDDAVVFHDTLNPSIWEINGKMKPNIREALLAMAGEFESFIKVDGFTIEDITISGSNAAYTYTPHSDIDLHLVVAFPSEMKNYFVELFDAKKNLYNLLHNQKIKGFDVEFYAQDVNDPVQSMGVYSVLNGHWIAYPNKVKANVDDRMVKEKVRQYKAKIEEVLRGKSYEATLGVWTDYKTMRKNGLAAGGEFSPENLAFKILRTQGYQDKLFNHLIDLRDNQLSVEHINEGKLMELFNTEIPLDIKRQSSRAFSTTFTVKDASIVVAFDLDQDMGFWDCTFYDKDADAKYGMTGKGNEMEVMGGVMQSMQLFVSIYAPQRIMFSAGNDGNRSAVYRRMLKRYLPNTYSVEEIHDGLSGTEFLITAV